MSRSSWSGSLSLGGNVTVTMVTESLCLDLVGLVHCRWGGM